LSSRVIQVETVRRNSGLRLTTRTAFWRLMACSLTTLWLRPPSPLSMMLSSSPMIGSGVLLISG